MKDKHFVKDSVRRNLPFLGMGDRDMAHPKGKGITTISISIIPMKHLGHKKSDSEAREFKHGGRVNKTRSMGKMSNFSEAFCKKKMPAAFKSGGSVKESLAKEALRINSSPRIKNIAKNILSNKKCGKQNMACGGKVNERSMPSHNDRHPMFKFLRDL